MTRHSPTRMASAVVGVLLSVGAQTVAAPSIRIDTPEPNAQHLRQHVVHGRQQPLIPHAVASPSSDFTTYVEGELVRVSMPSNWRELPGSNAVTFAPEGAYGKRRCQERVHSWRGNGARP